MYTSFRGRASRLTLSPDYWYFLTASSSRFPPEISSGTSECKKLPLVRTQTKLRKSTYDWSKITNLVGWKTTFKIHQIDTQEWKYGVILLASFTHHRECPPWGRLLLHQIEPRHFVRWRARLGSRWRLVRFLSQGEWSCPWGWISLTLCTKDPPIHKGYSQLSPTNGKYTIIKPVIVW